MSRTTTLLVVFSILAVALSFIPSVPMRLLQTKNDAIADRNKLNYESKPNTVLFSSRYRKMAAFSSSIDEADILKYLPDKGKFSAFFKTVVASGDDINKAQFSSYDEVVNLMTEDVVSEEDIDDLWIQSVGDAAGLNIDEAYELLCMVVDIPDPEDTEFLDKEFNALSGGKERIPFYKFITWSDVQEIMNEEILSMEEITEIWKTVAGDLNTSIDRKKFGKLNKVLDDKIDVAQEVEDTTLDLWGPSFDAASVFDDESLADITSFFNENSNADGTITFPKIASWKDIQEMISEGALTKTALADTWEIASSGKPSINFDTFLRFNVELDLIMDKIDASKSTTETQLLESTTSVVGPAVSEAKDAEQFYRTEFSKITGGGRLMRFDMLVGWKDIKELIDDGVVKSSQIERMFEGLPKEPMGLPATSFGITEETFVAFNGMLDVLLDSMDNPGSAVKAKGVTPSLLISEPQRPLPAARELKIGDIGSVDTAGDDSMTGLTTTELEMMKVLDSADNMLNSGSFGDFDQLIGDLNDPRLQALREKRDGAAAVEGVLQDIMTELLQLAREQKRCGLDRPDEFEEARIRDLAQAVIEKAPKAASRDLKDLLKDINGSWKLLYTNSEMFNFYNGITGFANVFPASKFQDLKLKYSSDGYLSESVFLERLTTPLGPVDATVYSNWDLVKEMSFMTNENSVVLRSYCLKVTAGPMEYEAQENWKSLRTMSMNEVVYVDSDLMILRNCGALRIYFVLERE